MGGAGRKNFETSILIMTEGQKEKEKERKRKVGQWG